MEDTRHGNPYDAVATKDAQTRYLEAKGTETDGASVIVTAGEVNWAKKHLGQCFLGVVGGIAFDAAGNLDATTGQLTIYSWDPSTGVAEFYDADVLESPTPDAAAIYGGHVRQRVIEG